MELKRKLYDRLLQWKRQSNGATALLIDGARRVGKSWLCKQFAENEYKSHILIDFGNALFHKGLRFVHLCDACIVIGCEVLRNDITAEKLLPYLVAVHIVVGDTYSAIRDRYIDIVSNRETCFRRCQIMFVSCYDDGIWTVLIYR